MDADLHDERTELQEDEEKLQIALQAYNDDQWNSSSEDEEDEEQLIIDLEKEMSEHTAAGIGSTKSSLTDAGSITLALVPEDASGEATPRPNLSLPSQQSLVNQQTQREKALALNRALQGILEGHIDSFLTALQENRAKQAALEDDGNDQPKSSKANNMVPFRAPYFKGPTSYPPANQDVLLKKQSNEPTSTIVKDRLAARKQSRVILRKAVVEDGLEKLLKPTMSKLEEEIRLHDEVDSEIDKLLVKLHEAKTSLETIAKSSKKEELKKKSRESLKKQMKEIDQEIKELTKKRRDYAGKIADLEKEIEKKKRIPSKQLLKNVDSDKVDWMKISKMKFGGNISWLDCQKAWDNHLKTELNRSAWTKSEEKRLAKLVAEGNNDWEDIARKLDNSRTAFQCFSHYQSHLNPELKSREWSKEEDERLVTMANKVKSSVGVYSWKKVASLMEARSPTECMGRLSKVDPSQNHGRWSYMEDAKLVAGVELLGQKWSKIAKFVGSRNLMQCRDRYVSCLAPNLNFTHFTYDEDVLLLKLYKQLGPVWAQMTQAFNGRTDNMLLCRHKTLMKYKSQMEWFEQQDADTKKMLQGKNLDVKDRKCKEIELKSYLSQNLGITQSDYTRRELEKRNGMDPDLIPPRPPMHLKYHRLMSSRRDGQNYLHWLRKLQLHKHLSANLERRLKESQQKYKDQGTPDCPQHRDDMIEEVIEKSVEETMKAKPQAALSRHMTMLQYKNLKMALNKMFLGEQAFNVQELIKATSTKTLFHSRRKCNLTYEQVVDRDLRAHVRKANRSQCRVGRARRFFEKDNQPVESLQAEQREVEVLVPCMLMKMLGTEVGHLHSLATLRRLDIEEELLDFQGPEQDPTLKKQLDMAEKIKSTLDQNRKQHERMCQIREKKLEIKVKKLKKVFKATYDSERKRMEEDIDSLQGDVQYLSSLCSGRDTQRRTTDSLRLLPCASDEASHSTFHLDKTLESAFTAVVRCAVEKLAEQGEIETVSDLLSASFEQPSTSWGCNDDEMAPVEPEGIAQVTGEASRKENSSLNNDNSLASQSKLIPVKNVQKEGARDQGSEVAEKDETNSKPDPLTASDNKTGFSQAKEDDDERDETQNQAQHPRKQTLRRKRDFWKNMPKKTGLRQRPPKPEPKPQVKKKRQLLNQTEIFRQRARVKQDLSKKIFTHLPYIPPNCSTLGALRTLLIERPALVDKAGAIYALELRNRRMERGEQEEFAHREEDMELFLDERKAKKRSFNEAVEFNRLLARDRGTFLNDGRLTSLHPVFDSLTPGPQYNPQSLSHEIKRSVVHGVALDSDGNVPRLAESRVSRLAAFHKQTASLAWDTAEVDSLLRYRTNALVGKSQYEVVLGLVPNTKAGTIHDQMQKFGNQPSHVKPSGEGEGGKKSLNLDQPGQSTVSEVAATDAAAPSTSLGEDLGMKPTAEMLKATASRVTEGEPHSNGQVTTPTGNGSGPDTSDDVMIVKSFPKDLRLHMDSIPRANVGAAGTVRDGWPSGNAEKATTSAPGSYDTGPRAKKPRVLLHSAEVVHGLDKTAQGSDAPQEDVELVEVVAQNTEDRGQLPSQAKEERETGMSVAKVNKIVNQYGLRNKLSRVVMVGMDKDKQKVVHFNYNKTQRWGDADDITEESFQPVQERSIGQPEDQKPAQPTETIELPEEETIRDVRTFRNSDEYKLLLARLRSLFTWPVLLSTHKPTPGPVELTPPRPPCTTTEKAAKPAGRKAKRARWTRVTRSARGVSITQRRHLKAIRNVRRLRRQAAAGEGNTGQEKEGENQSRASGSRDQNDNGEPSESRPSGQGVKDTSDEAAVKDQEEKPAKGKGKGRKRRRKEYEKVERNLRKTKQQNYRVDFMGPSKPEPPSPEEKPERFRAIAPQWWKDAMLAAMISKKEIDDAGQQDHHVAIDDDEDFQDKGDYSDDEWLEELRKEEVRAKEKKEKAERRRKKLEVVETRGNKKNSEKEKIGEEAEQEELLTEDGEPIVNIKKSSKNTTGNEKSMTQGDEGEDGVAILSQNKDGDQRGYSKESMLQESFEGKGVKNSPKQGKKRNHNSANGEDDLETRRQERGKGVSKKKKRELM